MCCLVIVHRILLKPYPEKPAEQLLSLLLLKKN